MAKNTDEMVMQLLQKVQARKKEIKAISRPNWLTTCTIGYDSDSVQDRVNIQTVTKPEKLIELYTFLSVKEEHWDKAVKDLGLESKPVYMGYPIASWKADLVTRAAQLTVEKKKKELETLEKRLDGLVTVEQRRELELAAIQKELGE